jgi:hypothetical protein
MNSKKMGWQSFQQQQQESTWVSQGVLKGSDGATGPTGPTGPGFAWKGAYNAGTAYVINDVVSYTDGSTYVCTASTTGHVPTNASFWALFTSVGVTGATGPTGQGLTFRGAYVGGTTYAPYDIVTIGGDSYICILASTGHTPPNATYWTLVASRGSVYQGVFANFGALPTIDGASVRVSDTAMTSDTSTLYAAT